MIKLQYRSKPLTPQTWPTALLILCDPVRFQCEDQFLLFATFSAPSQILPLSSEPTLCSPGIFSEALDGA